MSLFRSILDYKNKRDRVTVVFPINGGEGPRPAQPRASPSYSLSAHLNASASTSRMKTPRPAWASLAVCSLGFSKIV